MTDEGNRLPDGLGELDWDAALDEWEKSSFVPEVARDAETNRVAKAPDPHEADVAPRSLGGTGPLKDAPREGTVIAPVPDELLEPVPRLDEPLAPQEETAVRRDAAGPRSSGGLGQLFAKGKELPRPTPPPRRMTPPPARAVVPPSGHGPASVPPKSGEPSVTRQFAAPTSLPPEAYADPNESPSASFAVVDGDLGDAPTVSTRDIAKTAGASSARQRVVTGREHVTSTKIMVAAKLEDSGETATVVATRPALTSQDEADTQTRFPSDDEAPTGLRGSLPETGSPTTERGLGPGAAEATTASGLGAKEVAAFQLRAAWLEEEARALTDATDRARALLVVSELWAIAGERDRAADVALESRELGPRLQLAWRQTRHLGSSDATDVAQALDAEAAQSPNAPARAHATLLAADVRRIDGDGTGAVQRWESANKLDPADVRAPASLAALALAHDTHTSNALNLAENSELLPLARAVATVLRLRGAARPGAEPADLPINDGLRGARVALENSDPVAAAQAIAGIAVDPALQRASLWLSAALGATHIAGRRAAARALRTLAESGEALARRQLAARSIELGDPELMAVALAPDAPLGPGDRAAILVLMGQELGATLEAVADEPELSGLLDALSVISPAEDNPAKVARARRVAGRPDARAATIIGRLLATGASVGALDEVLATMAHDVPTVQGVALEAAVRARRFAEIGRALASMPTDPAAHSACRSVAEALFARRAGDQDAERAGWSVALSHGASFDVVVRAASAVDATLDLELELLRIADEMPDGATSAVLRLEALARSTSADDVRAPILERVHRAAPQLGIGAFLAERIGRRRGDLDDVLRWIEERRSATTDPLELALDAVREALLVADRDAALASTRLEEAHRRRPSDVALRDLYERLATDPPADRGSWRERRAESAEGPARASFYTQAAFEYERSGDFEGARRSARLGADAGDLGISTLLLERAEIASGETARQIAELTAKLAVTDELDEKIALRERLAELEPGAPALARHRDILELSPEHLRSLRFVEHVTIEHGEASELESIFERVALTLDGSGGGEISAHAQLAARFRARSRGWETTQDLARLAANQSEPSLWALRTLNAHARIHQDESAILKTTSALLERTQRPTERAALLLRASESAARLDHVADARALLEQAASEDPGDVVTWGFLAEVRERAGETAGAADACESLARTSLVKEHRILAWYDAARVWLDEVGDVERGMAALEQAAEVDVTHADVFPRLSQLYVERRLDAELARLLEKRLASVDDDGERVALEVELARALADMGEFGRARAALESALGHRPDHTTALGALADLCARQADWEGAEQAYVRLSRLLTSNDEQRQIYEKLGEIYFNHAVNLSRAEVAYREVLKRAPNDPTTLDKLVEIYKRQGDAPRAAEMQQELVAEATDPAVRLARLIDLSALHENVGRDARKAEQVLESARREFPTSVVALRALAEFYGRQRQMPAMQILLDRAAADARRSFAAGRFVTALFEVLHAAYELRGKHDAARVVAATLAAVEGHPANLGGADARALDPRLDELLAPETMSPALRTLLSQTGDALDIASPLDLKALRAAPLVAGTALGTSIGVVATMVGLGALQVFVSPELGNVALPLGSNPPALLVGEGLARTPNERARTFAIVRALKMILTHGSALLRGSAGDVATLTAALFTTFNPSFQPQGVDAKRVSDSSRRLIPALPRNLDPTVGVIALEAAGSMADGPGAAHAASTWANRVALLAVGDPNAALDAIAWAEGAAGAPKGSEERAAWIARTTEARELMTFSVTDLYTEARIRTGIER